MYQITVVARSRHETKVEFYSFGEDEDDKLWRKLIRVLERYGADNDLAVQLADEADLNDGFAYQDDGVLILANKLYPGLSRKLEF